MRFRKIDQWDQESTEKNVESADTVVEMSDDENTDNNEAETEATQDEGKSK